jgi:hypothetical protein
MIAMGLGAASLRTRRRRAPTSPFRRTITFFNDSDLTAGIPAALANIRIDHA